MGLRDRILEWVFPGLKKDRRESREGLPDRRRDRRRKPGDDEGYDPRYFIRHQR